MIGTKDPTYKVTGSDMNLHQGQQVYVKDPEEAWREATVFELKQDFVITKDDRGQKRKQKVKDICLRGDVDLHRVEDLTRLTPLNEATVLNCLDQRFHRGEFYTKAGCTIVAVNPFRDVSGLYTLSTMQKYRTRNKDLPPHIYQIADEAYWRLTTDLDRTDQSIVVSGESGAGKTVSTKHMLRYITTVASNDLNTDRLNSSSGVAGDIEKKIIDCNPILEAFGNAATPRNENSSRFGKFIDLQFDREGIVQGAAIQVYLLEKTRVPHQGPGECNFHIFYQLAEAGAEAENLPECLHGLISELTSKKFHIIPPSPETAENRSLQETVEALDNLGLQEDQLLGLLQVIAAILYLCNVEFKRDARDEDRSRLDDHGASGEGLAGSARMLGVGERALEKVMLQRNIQAGHNTRHNSRHSVYEKPVSPSEAGSRRDCLAMLLYARLFDWLVEFINRQITAPNFNKAIGLLDIYGFEVLKENSLEQLCINYANERLQQHFTNHVLSNLQMEYEEERVTWEHISYHSNQASLDLLEGQGCTFDLLNEQVYLNRAVDDRQLGESLQEMLRSKTRKTDNLALPTVFTIQHYAGTVPYLTTNLVSKNKDNIPVELVSLLQGSQCLFIQDMFADFQVQQGQGRKMKSVLTKFKSSLDELMRTLESRNVHYIRCIKPNPVNKAGLLQRPYCLTQLEACGIIEATHISRDGYAARFDYKDFERRYGLALSKSARREQAVKTWAKQNAELARTLRLHCQQQLGLPANPSQTEDQSGESGVEQGQVRCAAILTSTLGQSCLNLHVIQAQFGRSKLFLTQLQLEQLEAGRAIIRSNLATLIQKTWRDYKARLLLEKMTGAQKVMQRCWRHYVMRKTLRRLYQVRRGAAARLMQRAWRRCRTRRRQQCCAARVIWQAWLRYNAARKQQAAVRIQTAVRLWLYRKALRSAGVLNSMEADADRSATDQTIPAAVQDVLQSDQNSPVVGTGAPADQSSPLLNRNSDSVTGQAKVQKLELNPADQSSDTSRHRNQHPGSPGLEELENVDGKLSEMDSVRNGLSSSDGCLSQDSGVIDPDEVSASSSMESSVDPPNRHALLRNGRLVFFSCGDYIVSRKNIKTHRFHLKTTCLQFAYLPPPPRLSLADCLVPDLTSTSSLFSPSRAAGMRLGNRPSPPS